MEVGGHRSRRRRGRATRGGGGSSGFLPASDCFSPSSEACEQLVKALLLFFLLPRRRRHSSFGGLGLGGFHARLLLLRRRPEAEETHLDLLKIIPSFLPSLALCFPVSPAPGLCTHWPDATGLARRSPPPLGWLLLLPSRRGRRGTRLPASLRAYSTQYRWCGGRWPVRCIATEGSECLDGSSIFPVEVALLAKE